MTILRTEAAPGDAGSNPPTSRAPEPRLSGAAVKIDKAELRVWSVCFFCKRPLTISAFALSGTPIALPRGNPLQNRSLGSSLMARNVVADGRKTLRNRPCITVAGRRHTATRTWSSPLSNGNGSAS